jgi:hypothetical protein
MQEPRRREDAEERKEIFFKALIEGYQNYLLTYKERVRGQDNSSCGSGIPGQGVVLFEISFTKFEG